MRNTNELQNAFGEADDGFKQNVHRTLDALQKSVEANTMKKMSIRFIAATAVICLLTSITVLAATNTWGILDFFLSRQGNAALLPDASEIIQTGLPQDGGESDWANFTVREAIFDGENIYIVVAATPASPDYLLLGIDSMLSSPIGDMGPLFSGATGTIAEYAMANGKTPIHTYVGPDTELLNIANCAVDFVLESDGTLVYMISGRHMTADVQIAIGLTCITAPFEGEQANTAAAQKSTLAVTLQNTGTQNVAKNVTPAIYADCGVRVDSITLTGSPMAIYADIIFTVIDPVKFATTDDGLWFEFIDENGNRLPEGASTDGSVGALDANATQFLQKTSLQTADALPDSVTLRGYNCWDKTRYEAHTFDMR